MDLSQPVGQFCDSVFRPLVTSDDVGNSLISPLSLHIAMSILLHGAGNSSESQLKRALKLQPDDDENNMGPVQHGSSFATRVVVSERTHHSKALFDTLLQLIVNGRFIKTSLHVPNFTLKSTWMMNDVLKNMVLREAARRCDKEQGCRDDGWQAEPTVK